MTFEEILAQVIEVLQREGRVSYRALQRRFALDDAYLDDVKVELIEAKQLARDENGRILIWATQAATTAPPPVAQEGPHGSLPAVQRPQEASAHVAPNVPEAERRQLTVLFCDLVDSTVLASQLDPEELREVVRAYQATCAKVIARFEGHIAQYLGDGLLVYFGYPLAHEDDVQRAVRAGLGMIEAMGQLHISLGQGREVHLAVRLGLHTGLVVVGDVGEGTRQEQLALGETPNLAARLQGIAAPNTLVISATTSQLLGGFFACQPLGTPPLKGLAQPLAVYRVLYESMARSRLEAVGSTGWTPLVGREQEVGLLVERWKQVKDGSGQVMLLSGEAGIGKSRLVHMLKEQVASEPQAWLTPCQCLPYYQNSALYPLIDLLERVTLRFDREESPLQKLGKLEGFLVQYGLPLAETVPLLAALLSLPLTADYAPLTVAPEQQKQKTLHALLTILLRIAAQQPALFVMEDLHWVDPTTLEFLSLLVDQGPTARILALFTFRPDFSPPWTGGSHCTQITVHRLPRQQAVEVILQVAHGKTLPPEVVEQIVAKTDGVPLFIEELTKMVLESGLLQEREERYELTGPLPPLAIPATLHDSLMARLDRLAAVKGLAQLGATLGREFSYELLQAVSLWDEAILQRGLQQLVEAEFLYQQGLPPQATYVFKHALIQEAAYQSLLRSTRQQSHQRIAQVLEAQFSEIAATQPEVLAHHYTEAGLHAQAVGYWHQAGQRTTQRSAYQAYSRVRELCQEVGDTPQLPQVLWGLWFYYHVRAEFRIALEQAASLLTLAQRKQDPVLHLQAHLALGFDYFHLGELGRAQAHLDQGIAFYDPQQHRTQALLYGQDLGVLCQGYTRPLWSLGYPEQACKRGYAAMTLAEELQHPFSLAFALNWLATVSQFRREVQVTYEWAERLVALCTEQGFELWVPFATVLRGWALAQQGQCAEGIAQMQQGTAAWRATGAEVDQPYFLALLAEAYGQAGQVDNALALLAEALVVAHEYDDIYWVPEVYRLKGELLLSQGLPHEREAETCLHQALALARRQQAKSLELRAAMSLARLWQRQGKRDEARELLAPIYDWFTEGFDTADL